MAGQNPAHRVASPSPPQPAERSASATVRHAARPHAYQTIRKERSLSEHDNETIRRRFDESSESASELDVSPFQTPRDEELSRAVQTKEKLSRDLADMGSQREKLRGETKGR